MSGLSRLASLKLAAPRCLAQRTFTTSSVVRGGHASSWDGAVPEKYSTKPKKLCFGWSGQDNYHGDPHMPAEAVRFMDDTEHITNVIRPKEMGNWANMTLDEKKQLYRVAYQQTVEEQFQDDTGRWKTDVTWNIWLFTLATVWSMYFLANTTPAPYTNEFEYKEAEWNNFVTNYRQVEAMGLFDYEKNENIPKKWWRILD